MLKDDLARALVSTEHARRLASLGFRADLEFALKVDSIPVVPRLHDGRIEPLPA
jgi:phosphosulfolactate phosphohydrolase-like enzyme